MLRRRPCYPLLLGDRSIQEDLVNQAFTHCRRLAEDHSKMDILLDSGGGDIHAAYNLALWLRRFVNDQLTFVVPRWAKGAATLLACGGDEILMTPVAELGPVNSQFTLLSPIEQGEERFSPMHVGSTLQLIRDEFEKGNESLAESLIKNLQCPLSLGHFKRSLAISKNYVVKLLESRMLQGEDEKARKVGEKLTTECADVNWCIGIADVDELGLNVNELDDDQLRVVWKIYELESQRLVLIRDELCRRS